MPNFKDLNLENIDEKIKNYNLAPLLSKYQSFNYRYFKFASSSDIALIANGWVRIMNLKIKCINAKMSINWACM